MRIGIVGVGRMGSVHAHNLARMIPAGELLIHDIDPVAAEKVAADVGGSIRATAESLIDDVDAVVISTSTAERHGILLAAMDKGIPVFCEKPLVAELDEAREVAAAARRTGVRIQVGFQRRFDPDYRLLHQLVDSGAAGRVLMIRGTAFDHQPPDLGYERTSGDIFLDLLIHDIDAVRWIAQDEVVAVQADAGEVRGEGGQAIGLGTVVLSFARGGVAVLTASRLDPLGYDHRMEVLGTRLSMAIGLNAAAPLRILPAEGLPGAGLGGPGPVADKPSFTGFVDRFALAYRAEMRAFLTMATGDGPSLCGPDDAVRAQEIAVAAAAAASTGARTSLTS